MLFQKCESLPSIADIQQLFSRRALWQVWLDVEVALAQAQAELGMIPKSAADEIAAKANFEYIDETALREDIERTRAQIVSLVRALANACDENAAGYVHWGATTQNVLQTGRIVQMKRANDAILSRLGNIFAALAKMADTEADTLTIGRTNNRHALPITFGFKIAAWIEEFLRHEERLREAESRVFTALWGGALGAMHAFGENGPELNRRVSAKLGLNSVLVPSRAANDHVTEYVMLLALLATTCSKIAREFYSLMSDEVAEVYEELGDDVVGSSTMPHKINSKVAVKVIALGARLRAQVPLALEAMQSGHEGDAANNQMMYTLIDETMPLAYEMIVRMEELMACIRTRPERMKKNLGQSGRQIAAENAMMALAPTLGRTKAHDVVHHAVSVANAETRDLLEVLMEDKLVSSAISHEDMVHTLDPANYTGHSASLARHMSILAQKAANRLHAGK